jgi:hypothetical protein
LSFCMYSMIARKSFAASTDHLIFIESAEPAPPAA